jgi:hypothetical protein
MSWPRRLTLTFLSDPDNKPVRDLAVALTIKMDRKNDYHLGPFLTDRLGSIRVGLDEVATSIQQAQCESLMDYDPIDLGAWPKFVVEISIESKRGLRSRADRLRPFFPERSGRLDSMAAVASNPDDEGRKRCIEVDEGTTVVVTHLCAPPNTDTRPAAGLTWR